MHCMAEDVNCDDVIANQIRNEILDEVIEEIKSHSEDDKLMNEAMNEEVLKVRIEVDDNNAEAKIDKLKDNFDGISNNAKLSEKETKSLNKALASIKSAKVSACIMNLLKK